MNIEDESDYNLDIGFTFFNLVGPINFNKSASPSMNIVDKPDYSKIPKPKIQLDDYKHIYTFCTARISAATMHHVYEYLRPLRQVPWTC